MWRVSGHEWDIEPTREVILGCIRTWGTHRKLTSFMVNDDEASGLGNPIFGQTFLAWKIQLDHNCERFTLLIGGLKFVIPNILLMCG